MERDRFFFKQKPDDDDQQKWISLLNKKKFVEKPRMLNFESAVAQWFDISEGETTSFL